VLPRQVARIQVILNLVQDPWSRWADAESGSAWRYPCSTELSDAGRLLPRNRHIV